jgi:integrase
VRLASDHRIVAGRHDAASRLGKFYREAQAVRDKVDPFTAEKIPVLLDAARVHFGEDDYVLMLTAFHTGMRASELAGLQWSDIDFRNRFAIVRRQQKDGAVSRTKTRKVRKVNMSDALFAESQALRARRQKEYLGLGKNEIPPWVFLSNGQIIWDDGHPVGNGDRKPLDANNWRNRVFWRACDKAKIRRRSLHCTRHSFASILLMAGESPQYVREQLGHASIKMTVDVYGHFIPGANRQAVNKLPSIAAFDEDRCSEVVHGGTQWHPRRKGRHSAA